jgi:hypothetical protein
MATGSSRSLMETNVRNSLCHDSVSAFNNVFWSHKNRNEFLMCTAISTIDDGEWFEGKRHGFGKFYFQDGTMLKRMWENGKMLDA